MKKRLFSLVLIALLLCVLVCPAFASSNGDTIVYRTYTGECYHRASCGYLRSSKIEITLADAVARGLSPCSRCSPPRLSKEQSEVLKQNETLTKSSTASKNTTTKKGLSKNSETENRLVVGAVLFGGAIMWYSGQRMYGWFVDRKNARKKRK